MTSNKNAAASKPFSQACENNKDPILAVLRKLFTADKRYRVLEIGSGTGQHAVYFCRHLPQVQWQPSDLRENIAGINAWLNEAKLLNANLPVVIDVSSDKWGIDDIDHIFTANTCHIMAWTKVESFILHAGLTLKPHGYLCVYGPFNYPDALGNSTYTSESNARFDAWLKERDPRSGIRDFTAMNQLAERAGLSLYQDNEMPANNRLLVWQRKF